MIPGITIFCIVNASSLHL